MSPQKHPPQHREPEIELRDSEQARRFVWEGLLLQSVVPPLAEAVPQILEWYLEASVEGIPLPPVGVLADVGHLAFDYEHQNQEAGESQQLLQTAREQVQLPSTLLRQYEDLCLGKLYADRSFDRGVDGLRRYSDRRDRAKGLAFLIQQMGRRAGYRGVHLSPAVIRDLQRREGAEVLRRAIASLAEHGPLRTDELEASLFSGEDSPPPTLMEFLYQDLVEHMRNVGDVLGPEDVFELEHGTAIAGFGQRIALRQVLRAAAELEAGVPHQPVRPLKRHRQVATRIVDEDTYPIGGFSSISNRGSIESLLHSQLAYIENDERPDLFDVKFLRDELLYYARDENQFLRRRRSFVFALFPDLSAARRKDPHLPWQRIVLLIALLLVAVRKLTDWLSEDSLLFDFVFISPPGKKNPPAAALSEERELLEMLFREQIANETVRLTEVENSQEFLEHCGGIARRSLCHALLVSHDDHSLDLENAYLTRIKLAEAVPAVAIEEGELQTPAGESPLENWTATLVYLLQSGVAET